MLAPRHVPWRPAVCLLSAGVSDSPSPHLCVWEGGARRRNYWGILDEPAKIWRTPGRVCQISARRRAPSRSVAPRSASFCLRRFRISHPPHLGVREVGGWGGGGGPSGAEITGAIFDESTENADSRAGYILAFPHVP